MNPVFNTTRWSAVDRAASDEEGGLEAMDKLICTYRTPLLAHLQQRRGIDSHEAEDILQSFLQDKLVKARILAKADQRRGSFRNFLTSSLDNFARNVWRKNKSKKRHPEQGIQSFEELPEDGLLARRDPDSVSKLWALEVIQQACLRTRERCLENEKPERWEVLRQSVLDPILNGTERPDRITLARELKLSSERTVSSLREAGIADFSFCLHAVIAEYSLDDADATTELMALKRALAG